MDDCERAQDREVVVDGKLLAVVAVRTALERAAPLLDQPPNQMADRIGLKPRGSESAPMPVARTIRLVPGYEVNF